MSRNGNGRLLSALKHALQDQGLRMGYQPKARGYVQTVKAMMRIFDAAAEAIDLKTRIEAADALGFDGSKRHGGPPRERAHSSIARPADRTGGGRSIPKSFV